MNHVDESFQPKPDRGDRALAHRLLFEHGLDPAWVDELGAEQVECAAGSGRLQYECERAGLMQSELLMKLMSVLDGPKPGSDLGVGWRIQ